MSNNKKIRFATIGTNYVAKWFIEAASNIDIFELVAVYSRKQKTAEEFIQDGKGIEIYTDLQKIADANDIDAVYIASPTSLHQSQCLMMMKSGKHVLCEKPITSNTKQLTELIELADKNGVIIMEAMKSIYNPNFDLIKSSLIKLGQIGMVNFNFCKYSSRYNNFKKGIIENAFKPELSNGALMDIGVYCIEFMVGLFGKPMTINATGIIIPNSIDGLGHIVAKYDCFIAYVTYSKITNSTLACEIQGENGTLYFDNIVSPESIIIEYVNGIKEILTDSESKNDMVYEIQAFIDLIISRSGLNWAHRVSMIAMEIMDESRRQIGIHFQADL